MSEKQKKLILSIIEFLGQSIQDGTVKQDDREGLEVAVQAIGEAFGVDPEDQAQVDRLSIKPATLPSIFDVFLQTRDKAQVPSSASATETSSVNSTNPTVDKAGAEKLKATGNAHMTAKRYDDAIEAYTKAIDLDPENAVFYSNRAAAHSSKGDHENAVKDAEKALEIDPLFTKAYHRLGHAHYSLGDFSAAAEAFQGGLELDPSNQNLKSGLQNAKSRIPTVERSTSPATTSSPSGTPDVGGMADMLRNMGMGRGGGAGGGGGMPDLASMMNNPMFMNMAQQMMANGGLERLMSNPAVADMMNRAQSGNMPSMSELMSNPALRDIWERRWCLRGFYRGLAE